MFATPNLVRAALVVLITFIPSHAANAQMQHDVCVDQPTRQIDARRTAALRDALARTEPQVRQRLAGTWYAEIPSPELNTVDYQYQTFSPDGLFTYESRICGGMVDICSDFGGHGLWGAVRNGEEITISVVVSDLNRDRECFGATLRFIDDMTFQTGFGVVWRRVR